MQGLVCPLQPAGWKGQQLPCPYREQGQLKGTLTKHSLAEGTPAWSLPSSSLNHVQTAEWPPPSSTVHPLLTRSPSP